MICSDKKKISDNLGMGVRWWRLGEGITKKHKNSFGYVNIFCFHYGNDFVGVYIQKVANYTPSVVLLYVNCTLIKKKASSGSFLRSMIFTWFLKYEFYTGKLKKNEATVI